MRKATIATLAVLGVAAPVAATQAADAGLVHEVVATASAVAHRATPSAAPSSSAPAAAPATARATVADQSLRLGASGERVTAVQQALVRAGLMDHAATGYYGELTEQAVRTAQQRAGLAATGVVDDQTRAAVEALPAAPRPSATARATSTAATAAATPSSRVTSGGTPDLDPRCLTGHVMCVDKTRQRLYWVVDGKVVDDFSTRTGREGLATREGTFHVFRMEENSWSHEYQVTMPYAMYFSGGQAVHYSRDFATNGYGVGSHGCVNLRDRSGIAWLYSQVRLGDTVVVYRS